MAMPLESASTATAELLGWCGEVYLGLDGQCFEELCDQSAHGASLASELVVQFRVANRSCPELDEQQVPVTLA